MGSRRESRRCRRFPVKDGMIVFDSLHGEIIEMSFGGLSFSYKAHEGMATQPLDFALIFGGAELFLESIPLASVSDIVMGDEVGEGAADMRRRGMVFGELVPEQVVSLARFIKKFSLERH